ncbi:MAG: hypothetical protein OXM55_07115, partial [Bdellovibrionales bacterium]|nr:hypothetical protein [Bdellovibrionales bacterium]
WELALLPTAAWGTTAGTAQTIKHLLKRGTSVVKKVVPIKDRTIIINKDSNTQMTSSFGIDLNNRSRTKYILDSNGKKIGAFKEAGSHGYPHKEVLTYELCISIGCRVVPKTKYAKFRTQEGSYQKFAEGVTRGDLSLKFSSYQEYIRALQDTNSTIRQDFDEMVVLDLIGGNHDRNWDNYIIDLDKGRLHAIDNSYSFLNIKPSYSSPTELVKNTGWIEDAEDAQIFQQPISKKIKRMILQIDFRAVQHIFQQNNTNEAIFRERILRLQSILRQNPRATLEDLTHSLLL